MEAGHETTQALAALRDVAGVGGSFYISANGSLLGQDMPAYFDQATLEEVGPRALRLFEIWPVEMTGGDCLVRFEECRMYFRGNGQGLLCILLVSPPQMNALRTAADLIGRRLLALRSLPPMVAADPREVTSRAERVPSSVGYAPLPQGSVPPRLPNAAGSPPQAAADENRPKRVRIYRGQRFEY